MKPQKPLTVIIVDDDPDDREFIEDAFKEVLPRHENIHSLSTGDELLDNMKKFSRDDMPGMILLDLNMPGKDGNSILNELKANQSFSHIPIIILTTSSSVRDRDKCYHMGAKALHQFPSRKGGGVFIRFQSHQDRNVRIS